MSSAKWQTFCSGFNVLSILFSLLFQVSVHRAGVTYGGNGQMFVPPIPVELYLDDMYKYLMI